jgi:hypothetical protein
MHQVAERGNASQPETPARCHHKKWTSNVFDTFVPLLRMLADTLRDGPKHSVHRKQCATKMPTIENTTRIHGQQIPWHALGLQAGSKSLKDAAMGISGFVAGWQYVQHHCCQRST